MADNKKEVMEEAKSIDLKNASDEEIKNYAKDIVELPPEDMADVVTSDQDQYEYLKGIVDKGFDFLKDMGSSYDADTQQIVDMLKEDRDLDAEEDKALRNTEKTVQSEIAKILNDPDMPENDKKMYIDQWLTYYQICRDSHNDNKDRRNEQTDRVAKEIENKRDWHKRIISVICLFGLGFVGGYTGGKFLKNH